MGGGDKRRRLKREGRVEMRERCQVKVWASKFKMGMEKTRKWKVR